MYKYDFTDVFEAHQFVTEEAAYLFTKVQFNTERGKFEIDLTLCSHLMTFADLQVALLGRD